MDLDRLVTVRFAGLSEGEHEVRTWRVDALHGNVAARWAALGEGADWPDDEQWLALAAEDHLDEAEPVRTIAAGPDGTASVQVDLPMPGIVYLQVGA